MSLIAVIALCEKEKLIGTALRIGLKTPGFVAALTQWVNAAYWYFAD